MKPSMTILFIQTHVNARFRQAYKKLNYQLMNPSFTKLMICLVAALPCANLLKAQDTATTQTHDTSIVIDVSKDTTIQVKSVQDLAKQAAFVQEAPKADSVKSSQDADQPVEVGGGKRKLDKRWFIAPLTKFQFQDFAFLEKNRKGYLSDANTLPFFQRGNASFAASVYKNITNRLSASADIGLSFGHVTNDDVLISQTKSKTYNLLNASVYYHLLAPTFRLQPYIFLGINDVINDASYLSAPVGLGAKFNSKKIMALAQIAYGWGLSKKISNTTMYSVGVYLPIKNKKQRKQDSLDTSPYNRPGREASKKDTASKNGTIVNNFYITIKMDSLLNGLNGRKGGNDNNGNDNENRSPANYPLDATAALTADKGGSSSFDPQDFNGNDFKTDTVDGEPVVTCVVYFEFNMYSLTSKAFSRVDKIISHVRNNPNLQIIIDGYTDDVGTDEYNNYLSRQRAKMVYDYMNSRGVAAERMKARAWGKDNPVADNNDPNRSWLNRRAIIKIKEKHPEIMVREK